MRVWQSARGRSAGCCATLIASTRPGHQLVRHGPGSSVHLRPPAQHPGVALNRALWCIHGSSGTMAQENVRKHEVAFCAEVSKWADRLFEARSDLPFGSSDIESFGRGSNKRQDFRVYARSDRGRGPMALCGEVKLPGNPQARSPFDHIVMLEIGRAHV